MADNTTTAAYNDPLKGTRYEGMIWANLLHLSFNMWNDRVTPERPQGSNHAISHLRFDDRLWDDLLERMRGVGMNMVVLDLGDGVRYDSHPEIAVENAWSPERLRSELAKLRQMGFEPIPKLNFSTAHDAWLKDYSRMVSTPKYYEVCRDLIEECLALFDTPRFFHLGMDEETAAHQRYYAYAVMRQYELWWHDLRFYTDIVEQGGSRPWVWSDYLWHHEEAFLENMPKSVLQSNWYYDASFEIAREDDPNDAYKDALAPRAYVTLERHGYDQIPTGSNWSADTNFGDTVEFGLKHIARERLLGFMTAPWRVTLEERRKLHEDAIDQVGAAVAKLAARG